MFGAFSHKLKKLMNLHLFERFMLVDWTGAGLGIQNCGCNITFMSSFGKFVGADLKNCWGFKVA